MRSAICTSLAVALLWTGLARAQDAPESPADGCADLRAPAAVEGLPEPSRLERDGVAGMWFPMPIARLMLCEVRELRVRRREIALDARELAIWEGRVSSFEERLRLAVDARNELESVLEAAERRAREATEAANDWTRSPALWFAVGLAVAIVLAVAGGVLVADISP